MSRFPDHVYEAIQEALDYLCGPEYVENEPIKQRHADLLRKLAYQAPCLRRDEVVEFLRGVQIDRE